MGESSEHSLSLGPNLYQFYEACLERHPYLFITLLASAGAFTLATLVVCCRHAMRIHSEPVSLQKTFYLKIIGFPAVMAVTSFGATLCPRSSVLSMMLQLLYEALTLNTFGNVLFMMMAKESQSAVRGSQGLTGPTMMEALALQGPKKHFGVFPCGIWFRCCMSPHDLQPRHLLCVAWMVRQFVYCAVILPVFIMWCALALPYSMYQPIKTATKIIVKLSGFVAMYGLVILYFSTMELLRDWQTTLKFGSIKLMVLISTIQDIVLELVLEAIKPETCVLDKYHQDDFKHVASFYGNYFRTIEALVVAFLVQRAFPADDLGGFSDHPMDVVQLELEKLERDAARKLPPSSDESDDEGESDAALESDAA